MAHRKVKFLPINPIEEFEIDSDIQDDPVKMIEEYGVEGYFEFWGTQSRVQVAVIAGSEVPVNVVNIYGLTRDKKGNVFYCEPENIKFMDD